jgi:hypothetical protein
MSDLAYDEDFYVWAMHNAELLRQGRLAEIDAENIAEELESMGKSNKRALYSRLAVLMAHLLKWIYQPQRRSRSWRATIEGQRDDIKRLLADSPSLRNEVERELPAAYRRATIEAQKQTGIIKSRFPEICPFTPEQVLDDDYWPD